MKKTLAKVLALLMLAAMLVGCFAGCNTSGDDGYETKPSQEAVVTKPVITEPVEISVLTTRHSGYTTDAEDLWYFKYMEWWFAQQGYDVTINVQQTDEAGTQANLLLNTDSLPDLMFGIGLSTTNVVRYAIEDDLILDWTPYINESLMPNLTAWFESSPDIKDASVCPDNGIYGLPYIKPGLSQSGQYGTSERLYFRQSWLDAVGMENPTTEEELLAVLRAFKNIDPAKVGLSSSSDVIPMVSSADFLQKYLWTCLGFYGTEPNRSGNNLMIKDGELVIPAYTESYRDFVTLMKTFYDEGIIAQDFFSYTDASAKALAADGRCGAYCWWTLEAFTDDFMDIVCANPIPLGDVESVEDIHVSRLSTYEINKAWASADFKYPALLAMMMDFMYSDEGAFIYRYGVTKEEGDPLGIYDGWWYDEDGKITTTMVENGTYTDMSLYGRDWLFPQDNVGLRPAVTTNGTGEDWEYIDSVTGETYTVKDTAYMDPETNDGHWRLSTIEKWSDRATSVRLPSGVYLSADDTDTCADILSACQTHISTETAKFITGQRPLSEIEDFWAELKAMDIETYIEMQYEGRADWFETVFGE